MYELNGKKYTAEQLQASASKYGMDYDAYLEKMTSKGLREVSNDIEEPPTDEDAIITNILSNANFQKDPANAEATVGSKNNTASNLEQSLSDLLYEDTSKKNDIQTEKYGVKVDNTRVNLPKNLKLNLRLQDTKKDLVTNPLNLDYGIPQEEVEDILYNTENGIETLLKKSSKEGVTVVEQLQIKEKK